jgi:hypothetical protein
LPLPDTFGFLAPERPDHWLSSSTRLILDTY